MISHHFWLISKSRISLELKSWKQRNWISSKRRAPGHYSREPVLKNSLWQNRWTISELEMRVLKAGLQLMCNMGKEELGKNLITFIITCRLPNSYKVVFLIKVITYQWRASESRGIAISFGVTYEGRRGWRSPAGTAASRPHCRWSWLYCSSSPAWRSVCRGWAGVPSLWPSTKQTGRFLRSLGLRSCDLHLLFLDIKHHLVHNKSPINVSYDSSYKLFL